MIRRLEQLPSQPLRVRPGRFPQGGRVPSQIPRQSGPQSADALACLDNFTAAELAIPQHLEGDPIRDGPHRLIFRSRRLYPCQRPKRLPVTGVRHAPSPLPLSHQDAGWQAGDVGGKRSAPKLSVECLSGGSNRPVRNVK